jgi:hypothetical protein
LKSRGSMTSTPFMHWLTSQAGTKMMSHSHTFNLCSVPSKPSSKKLHSQGKPVNLLHIFAIITIYILTESLQFIDRVGSSGDICLAYIAHWLQLR